jgi:diaminopimelate decarboxylase
MELLAEARRATDLALPHLDLGGGLGIAYTADSEPAPVEDLAKVLHETVAAQAERLGTPAPTVSVEPGRSIVGPSMVTLYRSGVVKDVPGVRRYVSVDGGMSDNIRVPLYQARYTYLSASRPSVPHDEPCTIAGKLCETGDLLGEALLPSLEPDEIIACAATGAYGYAMASNYNKQPRPAVVGVADGRVTLLARRETYEDLTRLE